MDFNECLTKKIQKLCVITNRELQFIFSGEIEIEPGKLIKIRFLSEKLIEYDHFDRLRIDSIGGSGILVDVVKNSEVISSLYEYEYVATYGYFSGASVIEILNTTQIERAQIHCSRLHDLRLGLTEAVDLESNTGNFRIVPYQIDQFDYSVTTSTRKYYIEEYRTNPASIKEYLSDLDSVRVFISLIIDNPVNIDELIALVDLPATEQRKSETLRYYFYIPIVRYNSYEKRNELFNRQHIKNITTNLSMKFSNWNAIYSKIEQPIRVFYNTLYSDLIIDHKMLNLSTFLETYHKEIINHEDLSFKARLIELIQDNMSVLSLDNSNPSLLAKIIKEQRNIIAHTDSEYRLDQDLYKLVNSLIVLIQSLLLSKVFCDQDEVNKIMRSRQKNYVLYDDF